MRLFLPLLILVLAGCATKNIAVTTEVVKPPRPEKLADVEVHAIDGKACMSAEDLGKTFVYITDLEVYADQLELLLDSVTEEVK